MTPFRPSATPAFRMALNGLVALAVAMGIGRFAFTPQLPLMQAELDLSLAAGGWLAGANYLGYLVGAMLAGRRGMSAALLMRSGLWTVIATTAAMALAGPLAWWLAMRFIAGMASAWVMVGTATVVLARLARMGARRLDGLVFAGVGTGIALAGLICHGGSLLRMGVAALWLALAALALAGTWLVLTGESSAVVKGDAASAPVQLAGEDSRISYRLVLCYGLFGFGYILPATYLPSQARLLLGDPALFGWVWPLFGIAAALSPLSMALLARWPRKQTWAGAQAVMAAGVALPAMMPGLTGLALAAVCVGGTFMLITLLGLQQAREQAGAHAQKHLAAMTAAFAAGQLAGPIAVNVLLKLGGTLDAALWMGTAALLTSSALLVFFFSTKPSGASMSADQRIKDLGLTLSGGSGPAGNYAKAVQSGRLLFLSGKAPPPVDGIPAKGRLGSDYSTQDGYALARSACLDLLATLKSAIGSLDNVARVVDLQGCLCTTADFEDHARVLDGASDLLLEVFGTAGLHTRSVMGVYSLRNGVPLTIKATIELDEGIHAVA